MQKKHSSLLGILVLVAVFVATQAIAAPPADFRDLVKQARPAVVNISSERTQKVRSPQPGFNFFFRGHPDMERFFDPFEEFSRPRERKQSSLGSGFIISSDGYIVTNNHVIEGAEVVRVNIGQKGKDDLHEAEVIGTDPETDLALLKIKATGLPTLSFGNSEELEVGEWLVAIGSPLGLDHSVTAGILSAKGRNIKSGPFDDFLQTDASINRGNSGGPLLNMKGEVIGINTAIAQWAQGIGFAIPSNLAERVINDLKVHKKVNRGWLGVTIQNVDAATAKALGMKEAAGALVSSILDDQPAAKAGVKSGDVIIAINDAAVETNEDLLRKVAMLAPSAKATITVWRDGKEEKLNITVAERGGKTEVAARNDDSSGAGKLGVNVRPITDEDMRRHGLRTKDSGLYITSVEEAGLVARAGIRAGDIIMAANNRAVKTAADLSAQVEAGTKQRGAILLHVSRDGQMFFCGIEFPKK